MQMAYTTASVPWIANKINIRINFFFFFIANFLSSSWYFFFFVRTKKSAINKKKINSQIKKPHLKMIPIKDKYKINIIKGNFREIRRS